MAIEQKIKVYIIFKVSVYLWLVYLPRREGVRHTPFNFWRVWENIENFFLPLPNSFFLEVCSLLYRLSLLLCEMWLWLRVHKTFPQTFHSIHPLALTFRTKFSTTAWEKSFDCSDSRHSSAKCVCGGWGKGWKTIRKTHRITWQEEFRVCEKTNSRKKFNVQFTLARLCRRVWSSSLVPRAGEQRLIAEKSKQLNAWFHPSNCSESHSLSNLLVLLGWDFPFSALLVDETYPIVNSAWSIWIRSGGEKEIRKSFTYFFYVEWRPSILAFTLT